MKKIKALVIAPYVGLSIQIKKEAEKRDDIEVDCLTGNLDEGLFLAQKFKTGAYDLIISRGGTAALIQQNGFPVIDVPISLYDLLRSLRQASGARKRYAIVGFEAITKNATFLQDVLDPDTHLEIFTIHRAEEVEDVISHLKQEGIEIIVCDQISATTASRHRLNYILINSGRESINTALDHAVLMGKEMRGFRTAETFRNRIISNSPDPILLMENNEFINPEMLGQISDGFISIMKARANGMQCEDSSTIEYDDGSCLYSASTKKTRIEDTDYTIFYIKKTSLPFSLKENGIALRNSLWAHDCYLDSFYGCTNSGSEEIDTIESFAKRRYPVFIYGERGTGKGNLAQLLYSISPFGNNPLFDIDLPIAGKKATEFIRTLYTNNPEKRAVFHFKNMDKTDEDVVKELIDLNEEFSLSHRAYLIATATIQDGRALPQSCLGYVERLQCLTMKTRNLRDHREDISSIINLYIANLNRENGTDVISMENEGIRLLEDYGWPGNNDQLARVLKKLTTRSSSPIIKEESVARALSEEKEMMDAFQASPKLSADGKTLREMEKEIARQVLDEEKGNRTSTARRLGLSRATLWRMLQED